MHLIRPWIARQSIPLNATVFGTRAGRIVGNPEPMALGHLFVKPILIAPCSHARKPLPEACLYAFSSTRWVAYSEVLRSVMANPNA